MKNKQGNKIFYMIDLCGNRLEGRTGTSDFEEYGISNIDVLKNVRGLRDNKLYCGFCEVNFEESVL